MHAASNRVDQSIGYMREADGRTERVEDSFELAPWRMITGAHMIVNNCHPKNELPIGDGLHSS